MNMSMIRRSPFFDAFDLLDDVRRHFDGILPTERQFDWPERNGPQLVAPRVEENDEEIRLFVEAPGMTAEDIHIELDGQTVNIRGERKIEAPEGMRAVRRERSTIRFERSSRVPNQVDPDQVEARFEHGVLTVVLPKRAPAAPRLIPVRAA